MSRVERDEISFFISHLSFLFRSDRIFLGSEPRKFK